MPPILKKWNVSWVVLIMSDWSWPVLKPNAGIADMQEKPGELGVGFDERVRLAKLEEERLAALKPESVGGRKDDGGKERMDLIPPEFLFATARVLTCGAEKYGERNWESGMNWGRPFAAMMRHMWAWWGGRGPTTKSYLFDGLDTETGLSHLAHACACLAFLVAYEERGSGTDDRFVAPKANLDG